MRVETPQILWNSEGDKNVNAALLSVAVLSCGGGGGSGHGRSSGAASQHSPSSSASAPSAAPSTPMLLATAGNSSVINLWAVSAGPSAPTTNSHNSTTSPTSTGLSFRCSLTRQDGSCNCVRFSPNGTQLAAASEQALVVWSVPTAIAAWASTNTNSSEVAPEVARYWYREVAREQDLQFRVAARSGDAFMDVAWSSDSSRIVAGSIDHSVVVCEYSPELDAWKTVYRHDDHSHFVQGVAFDPLNVYIASMSSDRSVRVHGRKKPKNKGRKASLTSSSASAGTTALAATTKANADATGGTAPRADGATSSTPTTTGNTTAVVDTKKLEMTRTKLIKYHRTTSHAATAAAAAVSPEVPQQPPPPAAHPKHLFQDEATLESFVRRLAFTADGAYLVAPAAQWRRRASAQPHDNESSLTSNATLLFARHKWDEPCRVLTGMQKPAVAVRPCPVLFRLPETTKENATTSMGLPYRSVFCVLTWDSVLVYDTYHSHPLAIVSGLHYCNLVDAAWSSDGRTLFVCSTDGYVSVVQFDEGELGQLYVPPIPTGVAAAPTPPAVVSRVGTGAENVVVAEGPSGRTATTPKQPQPVVRSPVPTAGPPTLPPCEPGLTSLEAPPCKRVKLQQSPEGALVEATGTTTDLGMDQLTIHEPMTKKKRIQPTFISATN